MERRTSPGFEIAAKSRLWLDAKGADKFSSELVQLFLPEGERKEAHAGGGQGPARSQFGNEILLFSGSIRKGLLRNLLLNKVDVLLMTDVCGVLSDNKSVEGVMLASKHGLHLVKCKNFIDASDQVLFSRAIFNSPYTIRNASFILELSKVVNPSTREVIVSSSYGIAGNKVKFHKGKLSDKQLFIEFELPVTSQKPEEIEHQARLIAAKLGRNLDGLDASLKGAEIAQFPLETSYILVDASLPVPRLQGYYVLGRASGDLSCVDILTLQAEAKTLVENLRYARKASAPKSVFTIGSKIPV